MSSFLRGTRDAQSRHRAQGNLTLIAEKQDSSSKSIRAKRINYGGAFSKVWLVS